MPHSPDCATAPLLDTVDGAGAGRGPARASRGSPLALEAGLLGTLVVSDGAAEAGAPLTGLMRQTRHRPAAMELGYLRSADLWPNNVTK